jgi:hypothetical protein
LQAICLDSPAGTAEIEGDSPVLAQLFQQLVELRELRRVPPSRGIEKIEESAQKLHSGRAGNRNELTTLGEVGEEGGEVESLRIAS